MFRRALIQSTRAISAPFAAENTFSAVRRYPTTYVARYSTEPGKEEGDKAAEVKADGGNGKGNGNGNGGVESGPAKELLEEVTKVKAELEAKSKEAAEMKDKFLRSVADFRNLQDRTEREVRSAKDFAIQKFAKDLVETVDNMDLALNAVPEASRASTEPEKKDLVDLYNGLKMTEGILLNTLKKHGLEKVVPLGEKFDPNVHEATFQAKVEGKEPGTVFHVMRTGFLLNGRVLRAAQVGVVQAAQ